MTDQKMVDLLLRADVGASLSVPRRELARQVRERARRRGRMRGSAAVLALALCASALVYRLSPSRPLAPDHPAIRTGQTARKLAIELAQLDRVALRYERAAEALRQVELNDQRLQRVNEAMARPGPLEQLESTRARAALILLRDADRIGERPGGQARAAQQYRRAIELFPETPAAQSARQRLKDCRA